MKKILKSLLAAVAIFVGAGLHAATSDTINILVTPTGTKGVSIDATEINLGTQSVNGAPVIVTTQTVNVQNTGTISSSWSLRVDNAGTAWGIANSAGPNTYSLQTIFNSTQPTSGDFNLVEDSLSASDQQCVSVGKFGGDENCLNVAPGAVRHMWFKLGMPSSSNAENQQSIGVVITAS